MTALTPQLLLGAYASGIFPMAEGRHDRDLFWIDPDVRGVLPLEQFHLSRRLRRTLRQKLFHDPLRHRLRRRRAELRGRDLGPPGDLDQW